MDPRFPVAVAFVLAHETEYVSGHQGDDRYVLTEHDPDDAGGSTKYGIDQRSFPTMDISRLTLPQAIDIYFNSYWMKIRCDKLPDGYAEVCFDIAVNNGTGRAATLLQEAVGAKVDGFIGPITIAAAQAAGREGVMRLLRLRESLYRRLADERPASEKYLKGWLKRNNDLGNLVTV